jgi:hypothetical protein
MDEGEVSDLKLLPFFPGSLVPCEVEL